MSDLLPKEYRGDEELIRLTVEQVKKDFGSHLPGLQFSGQKELLFDELAAQIQTALRHIQKSNTALFRVILYRVDIRESDIPDLNQQNAYFSLAEKIVQREFQKVLTRRFFSDRGR